jgi:hypothetical protein
MSVWCQRAEGWRGGGTPPPPSPRSTLHVLYFPLSHTSSAHKMNQIPKWTERSTGRGFSDLLSYEPGIKESWNCM